MSTSSIEESRHHWVLPRTVTAVSPMRARNHRNHRKFDSFVAQMSRFVFYRKAVTFLLIFFSLPMWILAVVAGLYVFIIMHTSHSGNLLVINEMKLLGRRMLTN